MANSRMQTNDMACSGPDTGRLSKRVTRLHPATTAAHLVHTPYLFIHAQNHKKGFEFVARAHTYLPTSGTNHARGHHLWGSFAPFAAICGLQKHTLPSIIEHRTPRAEEHGEEHGGEHGEEHGEEHTGRTPVHKKFTRSSLVR